MLVIVDPTLAVFPHPKFIALKMVVFGVYLITEHGDFLVIVAIFC